jgi:hypothetical protein
MDFSVLESCAEIDASHANAAVASRDALRKLLARVAQIARPDEGCPKILLVLGRLARGDVEWLDGTICAELSADEGSTLLSILSDVGFGLFEPMFPPVRLDAPLDEFERAVKLAPKMSAPLQATPTNGKLLFELPLADAPAASFDLDDPGAEPASPSPPPARSPAPAAAGSAPAAAAAAAAKADPQVHTRPTVRRMVAIDPSLFTKRSDPRREDDD